MTLLKVMSLAGEPLLRPTLSVLKLFVDHRVHCEAVMQWQA